jgi:hypothetical protein
MFSSQIQGKSSVFCVAFSVVFVFGVLHHFCNPLNTSAQIQIQLAILVIASVVAHL